MKYITQKHWIYSKEPWLSSSVHFESSKDEATFYVRTYTLKKESSDIVNGVQNTAREQLNFHLRIINQGKIYWKIIKRRIRERTIVAITINIKRKGWQKITVSIAVCSGVYYIL